MSKFDVIISYALLLSVCMLIGSIGAAIGLPWFINAFFGGLVGWNWQKIMPWLDNKMKEFI